MANTHEYYRGYNDGFKEGFNKALEQLMEQEKNRVEAKIAISLDGNVIIKDLLK